MRYRLVIGYGSSLRGDDGAGPEIARRLRKVFVDPNVKIIVAHQLTPELAELVSQSDQVVFIDVSSTGQPGTWWSEDIQTDSAETQQLGHHLTPAALLAYTIAIYRRKVPGVMLSVAGKNFHFSEMLTPEVEAVVPEIVDFLADYLLTRR